MATILEMLLSTMTDDEKAVMRRKLAENPQILVADSEAGNLLSIYKGEADTTTPAATTTTTPPAAAHVPTVPVTSTTPVTTPVAAPAASADSAKILAALEALKTDIGTQVADLKKNAITRDMLPSLESSVITSAARINDEINRLRDRHKTELGENFDQSKFEEFLEKAKVVTARNDKGEATATRPGYPSLTAAWEAMTLEARNKKAIDKGIEEGVKQRSSAATVPGQTHAQSMAPAQAVVAKARATAASGEKSNAVKAAEALANIVRGRDGEVGAA